MILPEPVYGVIYVYELQTPDNAVVYVGQTVNPKARLSQHFKRFGKDIQMVVVRYCTSISEADTVEEARIEWQLHKGAPLTNIQTRITKHPHVITKQTRVVESYPPYVPLPFRSDIWG